MPIVEAHILRGYAPDEKRRLTSALTDAIRFVVPAPDDAVTVMLHEHAAEDYARGGRTRAPAAALPDPAALVRTYLAAMEARDLDAAQGMLAAGFKMTFPASGEMSSLADLVAWSKTRYRFVAKTYDAVEAFHARGVAVVYARGVLSGEWPDGAPFGGVRFIDRFEVSGDLIVRQDVWNDLAEARGS